MLAQLWPRRYRPAFIYRRLFALSKWLYGDAPSPRPSLITTSLDSVGKPAGIEESIHPEIPGISSSANSFDQVRDRLGIPVPKVLAYNTQKDANNVGAEYILMEKCPGIELGHLWKDLPADKRVKIVKQLATFSARLSKAHFPQYGSLYYTKDIPSTKAAVVDDTFIIGPTTCRLWFDDGRGEVVVNRGPWISAEQAIAAIIQRETECLGAFSGFPRDRQQGIFNGSDGRFHPRKESKMAVLQDCSHVLTHLIPKENAYTAPILWHNDLHCNNIFVNKERPTEITGIIDWQGVCISPAFLQAHFPSLIEYEGPVLNDFEILQLPPDLSKLDPVAQENARTLHMDQTIFGLYSLFIAEEAPDLLRTINYKDTLPSQIMSLIGSTFSDGEAYVQCLLSRLQDPGTWQKLVGSGTCPLTYSDEELLNQHNEFIKWVEGIELKEQVLSELGAYTGWDGAVPCEDYDTMKEKLENARLSFLDAHSKTPEEREQWAQAWSFQESSEGAGSRLAPSQNTKNNKAGRQPITHSTPREGKGV